MKRKTCLGIFLLLANSAFAQYSLDLSGVAAPEIKYLHLGNSGPQGKEIRVNNLYMEEGGVPQLPVMGELHYNRMDERYWRDALLKMKASGVNIVATYCIWSLHEEIEGQLSWEGNLNLRRFVELCKELGLKVHLRFGPYCNAEIRNGGLPDWIVNNKHLKTRTNDPLYLKYSRQWYESVYKQIKGLLWKDGGPIMALQLENEYVTPGMIIPHLMTLKKMAVEIGFDVPIYSMTHWMATEYPKGEIVPYAGFYIEAPWTTWGKREMPVSNFEFFTYNRVSDNIGTDIIKLEKGVESLSGKGNDSPFFTCEVGVGTATFYHRRAVVPEEMAGENINLRLGCGANLMGYYMYAGGTNPVGKLTTTQSSGPRVNYDYQAPVRECGTLGAVMPETKKYNYFMNDFGTALAPAVAYLPVSNQERKNLQWAVRLNGDAGYLFCSNILYRRHRDNYNNVQFSVKLKGEELRIPRKEITVRDGAYFLWPFNQTLGGVKLKYATVQPVCSLKEEKGETYFFFADDGIDGEYLISGEGIGKVKATGATVQEEDGNYFIDNLTPGRECVVTAKRRDGKIVRFVTLTEEESDLLWKERVGGKEFVGLSEASLVVDGNKIKLISEQPEAELWMYGEGRFERQAFRAEPRKLSANVEAVAPLSRSLSVSSVGGGSVKRNFRLIDLSDVERAYLRYTSSDSVRCTLNGKDIKAKNLGEYSLADITALVQKGDNAVEFTPSGGGVAAEFEILLRNGSRVLWNTDETWLSSDGKTPVTATNANYPRAYAPDEHLAVYEITAPAPAAGDEETRMYVSYRGDVANAYLNGRLYNDSYNDGTEWIISLNRLREDIDVNPLTIRIDGLKSADANIYFEKNVSPASYVTPGVDGVRVVREYRFDVNH